MLEQEGRKGGVGLEEFTKLNMEDILNKMKGLAQVRGFIINDILRFTLGSNYQFTSSMISRIFLMKITMKTRSQQIESFK